MIQRVQVEISGNKRFNLNSTTLCDPKVSKDCFEPGPLFAQKFNNQRSAFLESCEL